MMIKSIFWNSLGDKQGITLSDKWEVDFNCKEFAYIDRNTPSSEFIFAANLTSAESYHLLNHWKVFVSTDIEPIFDVEEILINFRKTKSPYDGGKL